MAYLRKPKAIILPLYLFFVLSGCAYTESGKQNFNRNISISVVSGSIYISIVGHISENIYFVPPINDVDINNRITPKDNKNSPVVYQGKETIKETIILNETQEYKYTLTMAEAVIMTIRSLDNNDAIIIISEYGKEKEYKIIGQNRSEQIISFKN
jgi:midasin (ATPase involved in ribosome maturation)